MQNPARLRRFRSIALACSAVVTAACGSKTGLRVPPIDAGRDVRDVIDEMPPPMMPSYLGTEFWAVSTSNSLLARSYPFHFAAALGNPGDAPVDITITGGGLTSPMRSQIAAHQTVTLNLPWVEQLTQRSVPNAQCGGSVDTLPDIASTRLENGAYRIVSSAPINAYEFNPLEFTVGASGCTNHSYTNDASLLLPTEALGSDYLVMSYDTIRGSFVAITGTQETPTDVTVVPRTRILGSALVPASDAGVMRRFTIARGEVVQLISDGDLTGSEIHASAPVAVISGVDCTTVSGDGNAQPACDHLEEQIFPLDTWGREVIVTQLRDRAPEERYMVRILSSGAGNQITFDPPVNPPAVLGRGEWVEFESDADFTVRGTQPILVAQYMEGQLTVPDATTGDPAMVLEVPSRQYRRDYSFVVPATYTSNFVQITAQSDATITLDGRPYTPERDRIAGTPWTVIRQRITAGSHTLATTDPAGMGLKVVGIAEFTSYMYPGGLDLSRE